jgi:hypothetical protein
VGVWPGIFHFTQRNLFTGKTRRRPNYLDRALQRSEGEITTETESSSGEEDDSDAAVEADEARRKFNRFKIPKLKKAKFWTCEQLENFQKKLAELKKLCGFGSGKRDPLRINGYGKTKDFGRPLSVAHAVGEFRTITEFSRKSRGRGG